MKVKRQLLPWVIGLVVVSGVIFLALRPRPIEVEAVTIGRGGLRTTIPAEGRTRIHDRFVVAAPVTGRLRRIDLHRGDNVQAGATVARVDPLPLDPLDPRQRGMAEARLTAAEAAVREAEALVARERTSAAQSQRERERAEKLVESGDLPRQEFERIASTVTAGNQGLAAALARVRIAEAEVEAARAALRSLSATDPRGRQVEAIPIRAPVSGRVLRLHEESERVVTAGTPLIEISNPATLELVIEVLSSDAVRIRPGAEVIVERWGGDHPLPASVRLIEPSAFTKVSALGIEEQRVNIVADLLERPDALGDGYRIETRIVIDEIGPALKAPLGALFRQNEGWAVYVIAQDRAQSRAVTIGNRSDDEAEVLAGLTAGERVVLHPPNDLKPGARVTSRSP